MPKYKEKSKEIEAVRWVGNNIEDIEALTGISLPHPTKDKSGYHAISLIFPTETIRIHPGDYLIRRGKEDFVVCTSKAFDLLYEEVEQC